MLMAVLNVLVALLIIAVSVYVFVFRLEETSDPELFALPVVTLLSFSCVAVVVVMLRPMHLHNLRLRQAENSLEDLSKLNNVLRAQRHDFMNHLQVVHSLIELGEHREANGYIDRVYASIEKVSSMLRTCIPAVNAILEAKRKACQSRGIEVAIEVNTSLEGIPIPDWKLCGLLGNIVDNSISALSGDDKKAGRFMSIEIFEDLKSYRFRISNNGPPIPQELWDRIFDAGFTTKQGHGQGMGLAICKEILSMYNGKLWVISDEYETVFEGFVPRCHGSQPF